MIMDSRLKKRILQYFTELVTLKSDQAKSPVSSSCDCKTILQSQKTLSWINKRQARLKDDRLFKEVPSLLQNKYQYQIIEQVYLILTCYLQTAKINVL